MNDHEEPLLKEATQRGWIKVYLMQTITWGKWKVLEQWLMFLISDTFDLPLFPKNKIVSFQVIIACECKSYSFRTWTHLFQHTATVNPELTGSSLLSFMIMHLSYVDLINKNCMMQSKIYIYMRKHVCVCTHMYFNNWLLSFMLSVRNLKEWFW